MGKLAGKVAVITGSTRGLGLGIAEAYAREGAAVVISSRTETAVSAVVAQLKAKGYQASGLACDVADMAQVQALADHAVSENGRFHIWVNNAGLSGVYGPTIDTPADWFETVTNTNILGTYHGSRAAMRHFLSQNDGKLINMLGRGEKKPAPLQNVYGSSKMWVRSFTVALAKEYKDTKIGVFAFNPGLVDTDMLHQIDVAPGYEDTVQTLKVIIPMWGNPPEVPAEKAVWLASSATDGKTGKIVRVLGPKRMLTGLLREGWRRITRAQATPVELTVNTVDRDD